MRNFVKCEWHILSRALLSTVILLECPMNTFYSVVFKRLFGVFVSHSGTDALKVVCICEVF